MSQNTRLHPLRLLIPLLILCSALALVLSSCARNIGYGLVLWAEEESPVQTGEILPVQQESTVQGSYLIRLPGTKQLI